MLFFPVFLFMQSISNNKEVRKKISTLLQKNIAHGKEDEKELRKTGWLSKAEKLTASHLQRIQHLRKYYPSVPYKIYHNFYPITPFILKHIIFQTPKLGFSSSISQQENGDTIFVRDPWTWRTRKKNMRNHLSDGFYNIVSRWTTT